MSKWWYNTQTKQVEEGKQSLGVYLLGPFDSAEEAARAPEKLQQRSREWAEEEERER